MGVELTLVGVRKLKGDEIIAFTGKTALEISGSTLFEQLFTTNTLSYYVVFDPENPRDNPLNPEYSDILPVLTPIIDSNGKTLYVCWWEIFANYWHKNDHDREIIEDFFEEAGVILENGQVYPRIPYEIAGGFLEDEPLFNDETEEIIVMVFC